MAVGVAATLTWVCKEPGDQHCVRSWEGEHVDLNSEDRSHGHGEKEECKDAEQEHSYVEIY